MLGLSMHPVPVVVCPIVNQTLAEGSLKQTSNRRRLHDGDTMYGQVKGIKMLNNLVSMPSNVATDIRADLSVLRTGQHCKALSGGVG